MKSKQYVSKTRSTSLSSRAKEQMRLSSSTRKLSNPVSARTTTKKRNRTLESCKSSSLGASLSRRNSSKSIFKKSLDSYSYFRSFVRIENLLEEILVSVGKSSNISKIKYNYLRSLNEIGYLKTLDSLKEMHEGVQRSIALEISGVYLIDKYASKHTTKLKQLCMVMHQNSLELIDLYISSRQSSNKFMRSVAEMVSKKKLNQTGNSMIEKNCELIYSFISQILSSKKPSRLVSALDYIIKNPVSISRAKSLLSGAVLLTIPFLPEKTVSPELTLVLDLDETLVHYREPVSRLLIRPHCFEFLQEMGRWYELVVFTAALQEV